MRTLPQRPAIQRCRAVVEVLLHIPGLGDPEEHFSGPAQMRGIDALYQLMYAGLVPTLVPFHLWSEGPIGH